MATDLTKIELQGIIAKGGQSVVLLGRIKDSFESVAVKKVTLNTDGKKNAVSNEIGALERVPAGHRNIVHYKGAHIGKKKAFLVFEHLPFPTVTTFLSQYGALSTLETLYFARQMIETVRFLCKYGVAHRDIKSDNILINPKTLAIKLVDFGLSSPTFDRDESPVGTPLYMAPAVLAAHSGPTQYSVMLSECWSLGILFWELLLGHHPFSEVKDLTELAERQKNVQTEIRNSKLSSTIKPFLMSLLRYNEEERISIHEAYAMIRAAAPRRSPSVSECFDEKSNSMTSSTNSSEIDSESESSRRHWTQPRGSISMLSKSSSPRLELSEIEEGCNVR